jgi:hypothetical protein
LKGQLLQRLFDQWHNMLFAGLDSDSRHAPQIALHLARMHAGRLAVLADGQNDESQHARRVRAIRLELACTERDVTAKSGILRKRAFALGAEMHEL